MGGGHSRSSFQSSLLDDERAPAGAEGSAFYRSIDVKPNMNLAMTKKTVSELVSAFGNQRDLPLISVQKRFPATIFLSVWVESFEPKARERQNGGDFRLSTRTRASDRFRSLTPLSTSFQQLD